MSDWTWNGPLAYQSFQVEWRKYRWSAAVLARFRSDPCRLVRQVNQFAGSYRRGPVAHDPCRLARQVKEFNG